MPPNMRPLLRVARLQSAIPRNPLLQRAYGQRGAAGTLPGGTPGEASPPASSSFSASAEEWPQAMPIGPFYEAILNTPQPIPEVKPELPPTSSPKSPRSTTKKAAAAAAAPKSSKTNEAQKSSSTKTNNSDRFVSSSSGTTSTIPPQPTTHPSTAQDKARIIFGSRLAGPAERADRLQAMRDRSVLVAGVLVPPRPEEPDNCCMSGCVNCVWDRYRDDLEEWAAAETRAETALQAQQASKKAVDVMGDAGAVRDTTVSTDKDETNQQTDEMKKTDGPKIAKDLWDDDLYTNIPVGIREFMKNEKKLKEKHEREGTFGA